MQFIFIFTVDIPILSHLIPIVVVNQGSVRSKRLATAAIRDRALDSSSAWPD